MKLGFELTLKTFLIFAYEILKLYGLYAFFVHKIERVFLYIVVDVVVDKTGILVTSTI